MSESWTDDDRFSLVEQMRRKQREFHSRASADKASLLRECKAIELRVDAMLADRKKPRPRRDLFGEEI